ncbi:MAG: MotA/TolQ/ExbB proton channel family protein [Candidatus Sumerlaeota bacterium]|nr:MotA/TolQ/ExbB proton channel family protein [Candidatus Sumerlaeota bacterium]
MEQMGNYFQRYILDGGIMMVGLVPASIIALGNVIQLCIVLRRARVAPKGLIAAARSISSPADYAAFRQGLPSLPHPLARVALGYLEAGERGQSCDPDENPGPLDDALDRLYSKLNPLMVIYTVSPLMGLLGTILGMMNTFFKYAVLQSHDLAQLSKGIMEALITTMWGLYIAIPVYVCVALLRGRIFRYEKDILPEAAREIMRVCAPYAAQKRQARAPSPREARVVASPKPEEERAEPQPVPAADKRARKIEAVNE